MDVILAEFILPDLLSEAALALWLFGPFFLSSRRFSIPLICSPDNEKARGGGDWGERRQTVQVLLQHNRSLM